MTAAHGLSDSGGRWEDRQHRSTKCYILPLLCELNTLIKLTHLILTKLRAQGHKFQAHSLPPTGALHKQALSFLRYRSPYYPKHLTFLTQYKVSPLAPFYPLIYYTYFTDYLEYLFHILTRTRQGNSKYI